MWFVIVLHVNIFLMALQDFLFFVNNFGTELGWKILGKPAMCDCFILRWQSDEIKKQILQYVMLMTFCFGFRANNVLKIWSDLTNWPNTWRTSIDWWNTSVFRLSDKTHKWKLWANHSLHFVQFLGYAYHSGCYRDNDTFLIYCAALVQNTKHTDRRRRKKTTVMHLEFANVLYVTKKSKDV